MSTISEFKAHIEQLTPFVERKELALKLENIREFRKLILEDFLEKECARFTKLSVDFGASEEDRADALGMAQAAGYFQRWWNTIVTLGTQAERSIAETKESLEELRQEGYED